ncbi:MAG: DUF29 domain-containing protein [Cyanobacterium sp. T60_A2020_053]|nr:DUF29 domain-containing protein [Cyanobacterium sp. T60_A2020_053]
MTVIDKVDLKKLYEIDDYLWIQETVKLLKENKFNDLDLDNLIEELDDLGRERKHSVENLLKQVIIHLLLLQYWQKEYNYNASHWRGEIRTFRQDLELKLTTNLQNYLTTNLEKIYQKGLRIAMDKTELNSSVFPPKCPYTLEQLLNEDWFPHN